MGAVQSFILQPFTLRATKTSRPFNLLILITKKVNLIATAPCAELKQCCLELSKSLDITVFQKSVDDCINCFNDCAFGGIDGNVCLLWSFIRIADSSEILHDSLS